MLPMALPNGNSIAAVSDRMEAIIARMACHARSAPAARLRVDEMNALLRDMRQLPIPPMHPWAPDLCRAQAEGIERLFGRAR